MRLAFTLLAVILPAAQRCTAAVAAAHITAETGVGIIACVADAVAIRRLPQLQIAAAVDLYLAMTAVQRRTLIAPLLSQLNINAIRRLYLAGLGRNMLLLAAAILPLSPDRTADILAGRGRDAQAGTAVNVTRLAGVAVAGRLKMVTVCLQADAAVGSLVLRPPVMHPVARRDLNSTRLDLRGLRLGIAAALCTGTSAGGGIDPQIRFADGANFIDYAVGIQAGAFLHRPFQRTGHRAVVNARARLGMDLGTLAAVAVAIMGLQMLYAGGLLPVDATGLVMRPLLRQLIRRRNSQVTTDLTAAALRPDLLILCIAVAIVPS